MRCVRVFGMIGLGLALAGCPSTPNETVELSNVVGRDLIEVQRAHRELAIRYFAAMKDDINDFVDNTYRPYIIQFTLDDPNLRFMERFQASLRPGADPDAVDFMGTYSAFVIQRVEGYRRELMAPIEAEEANLLTSLDTSYQRLLAANAAVTAHLASVIKVNDLQDELLADLSLPGLRQQIIEGTVRLSDGLAELIERGSEIDRKAEDASEKFAEIVDQMNDLIDREDGQ